MAQRCEKAVSKLVRVTADVGGVDGNRLKAKGKLHVCDLPVWLRDLEWRGEGKGAVACLRIQYTPVLVKELIGVP